MVHRPRVAILCSVYFPDSHADVIAGRLLEGYTFRGEHQQARVEVVSMYLEQLGSGDREPDSRVDIGLPTAYKHGIPIFATVGEALGVGRGGLAVDGVVIIAEHGDYGWNEFGQKLYPRRRLFDASIAAMIAAQSPVPIFIDKHLAWNTADAAKMLADAKRLGIPVLAGSSMPLAWRSPVAADWPYGEPMTHALVVGVGPTKPAPSPSSRPAEQYGWHQLEYLQALVERRRGGETGVSSVRAFAGGEVANAIRMHVPEDLLVEAVTGHGLDPAQALDVAQRHATFMFMVEYRDGLRTHVVNLGIQREDHIVAALRGPTARQLVAAYAGHPGHGHFSFLARQIESLMLNRSSPYPAERSLLTGGIVEAALKSISFRGEVDTPHLAISYSAPEQIHDTGIDEDYGSLMRGMGLVADDCIIFGDEGWAKASLPPL